MAVINSATASKPKAVSGAIYKAPLGTTAPTDATASLSATFKSVGYISDDGVTNSPSITSEDTKCWGGLVVMSTVTEKIDDFKFKIISPLNEEALKLVYGDANVTVATGGNITVKQNASEPAPSIYVIEMILDGVATRIVIPKGKLSDIGDIVYNDSDAVGYDVTISALADASDNTHYMYVASTTTTV